MFSKLSIRLMLYIYAAVIILGMGASEVLAEVPHLITYQGQLTDDTGTPLDTVVDMTFALFNDSLGTLKYWEEVHSGVMVSDGLFEVTLGETVPFPKQVYGGGQCWLGISIGSGAVMQPLTPMTSTLYAFRAQRSDTSTFASAATNADTADYAVAAGHSDTADVALNAGANGWVDAGNVVILSTISDSIGIGTNDPRVPLEVQGSVTAIIGESHSSGLSIGVLGGNDNSGIGVMGTSNDGRGVSGISVTGFGGHFFGPKNYISGNLGLGTENPEEMLHIYRNNSGANSFLKVQSAHVSNWGEAGIMFENPDITWNLRVDDDSYDDMPTGGLGLRCQTTAIEVMTWKNNGNVGIGTTDPLYRLEVTSNASAIRGRSTVGYGVRGSSELGYGGYFEGPKHYFNGLTGFGTTAPTHRVTVNGELALQKTGVTKYHLNYYNAGFNICETSVADYRLYIKDGGNVGIGTSSPTEKLHVNGNVKVGGTITAEGMLSTSITDEAGLVSSLDGSTGFLSGTWTTVRSRTITVPGPGYVVAMSSGYSYIDHGLSGADKLEYGISASSGDVPSAQRMWLRFGDDADAGAYWLPLVTHNVFEATSAASYTFYFLARRAEGNNNMWIDGASLILMFFPTAYGTVSTSTKSQVELSPPPPEQHVAVDKITDIDSSAFLRRIEALAAEVEQLKNDLKVAGNE